MQLLSTAVLSSAMLSGVALRVQNAVANTVQKGDSVMSHAVGSFEIKIAPVDASEIGKAGGVSAA